MAFSTSSWFNNAIVGIPQVGADVDIFTSDTTPKYAVGTEFTRSDGAKFVYSHFAGGSLSSGGLLVATSLIEMTSTNASSKIYASGSVTAIAGETIKPGTAGSHYVQIIGKGVSADKFAGGYLQITDGDGFGYQYRIRGNTAAAQLTTGAAYTYYVELYEPLEQTLASAQNTWCRIVGSRYADLKSADAASGNLAWLAGVTTCSHAAGTWGWVQRNGVAPCRVDDSNCSVGSVVSLSAVQPGCVDSEYYTRSWEAAHAGLRRSSVGTCVASASAIENQIVAVHLQLD